MNKIINFIYKSFYGPYPCGRTSKDSYLCCTRPINKWTSYLSKDKTKVYCRFCNSIKMMSSTPIDINHPWGWA